MKSRKLCQILSPPAGGSASFVYSIDNPVENGRLEAEPSDTWMSDVTVTDDEVRFNVEANETEELREGSVLLTYVYGEDKTVNAVVNVSQAVMQSGEEPVPTITITTEEKHIRGRRRRRLDYRHQLRYRWSHNLQRSSK